MAGGFPEFLAVTDIRTRGNGRGCFTLAMSLASDTLPITLPSWPFEMRAEVLPFESLLLTWVDPLKWPQILNIA